PNVRTGCRNSVCINGRCKCDLGYAVTGASGAKCEQVFCNASTPAQQGRAVCREHFGENVQCNLGNECSCDPYFQLRFCDAYRLQADGQSAGRCLHQRPQLLLGVPERPAVWLQVRCSEDSQCLGHWPHTACFVGSNGGCDCDGSAGYVRTKGGGGNSQSCVLRSQLLGMACKVEGDCGRGAHCVSATVSAPVRRGGNQMDCQAISCQSDGECQQFGDANLVCQSSGGCVCRKSYQVNLTLAQCTTTGLSTSTSTTPTTTPTIITVHQGDETPRQRPQLPIDIGLHEVGDEDAEKLLAEDHHHQELHQRVQRKLAVVEQRGDEQRRRGTVH
ncbi:hypothetical protein TYRP_011615, partial [Tyrophagus putrescentiae]